MQTIIKAKENYRQFSVPELQQSRNEAAIVILVWSNI